MSSGIYMVINNRTGKIYVGKSIDVEKRWRAHCNTPTKTPFHEDIRKYGENAFSIKIIYYSDNNDELVQKETEIIRFLKSCQVDLYNINDVSPGRYPGSKNGTRMVSKSVRLSREMLEAIKIINKMEGHKSISETCRMLMKLGIAYYYYTKNSPD